jgi:hypothetical protein
MEGRRPLRKGCAFCGRYFVPDRRVGDRQKACGSEGCRRKRKEEAQRLWVERNPGYFRGRYEYVKEWREKRKARVIQDEIPTAEPLSAYVLLIPDAKTGMIQDEIILRRITGSTFAAYG